METRKGIFSYKCVYASRDLSNRPRHSIALSCLLLLMTGCTTLPELGTQCESYGVREDHLPMGTKVHIEPLYSDELRIHCADVKLAVSQHNSNANIRGCVIPGRSGLVSAYYRVGDHCAMNHELCHAIHGPGHTPRYLRDLRNGVPMPYCPENQLTHISLSSVAR